MSIEVLKQALDALESCGEGHITDGGNQWHDAKLVDTAITSLRQAITELEIQEPVAWADHGVVNWIADKQFKHASLLYTHPPQRTEQEPVAWRAPNWGHSADEYVYRDFDDPVIGVDGKPSPNNEPLYTHPPQRTEPKVCCQQYDTCLEPCTPRGEHLAQRTWVGLMRGVRVEGDTVVISVHYGNDAARQVCGALIEEMNT